jgi:hypothetical protein
MNIKQKIIGYMRTNKIITPFDAIREFHNYKLSTNIGELIKDGYEIGRERVNYTKSDGTKSHYTQYWLISEPERSAD